MVRVEIVEEEDNIMALIKIREITFAGARTREIWIPKWTLDEIKPQLIAKTINLPALLARKGITVLDL